MNSLYPVVPKAKKIWNRLRERSDSNFKFAFLFLKPEQQRALRTVYAYCRRVDDIVDELEAGGGPAGKAAAATALQHWRQRIASLYEGRADDGLEGAKMSSFADDAEDQALLQALQEARRAFDFEREPWLEIIEGCAMDLEIQRYRDQAQLELYCYRVASCVGFLCLSIFGDTSAAAKRYARHLGLALQYTNILRDVAEDAQRGRIYLPLELLQRHGLEEQDILRCRFDQNFVDAAREFADLAQSHYDRAQLELKEVEQASRLLTAQVMGQTYFAVLQSLRAANFNVYTRRPRLRRRDKMMAAAKALASTHRPRLALR